MKRLLKELEAERVGGEVRGESWWIMLICLISSVPELSIKCQPWYMSTALLMSAIPSFGQKHTCTHTQKFRSWLTDICKSVWWCVCLHVHCSSLYVSGFSSDTRCRDLEIKSQSVCHLLTLLPPRTLLVLPPSSLSLSLRPFIGEWLVPYWLFAV